MGTNAKPATSFSSIPSYLNLRRTTNRTRSTLLSGTSTRTILHYILKLSANLFPPLVAIRHRMFPSQPYGQLGPNLRCWQVPTRIGGSGPLIQPSAYSGAKIASYATSRRYMDGRSYRSRSTRAFRRDG